MYEVFKSHFAVIPVCPESLCNKDSGQAGMTPNGHLTNLYKDTIYPLLIRETVNFMINLSGSSKVDLIDAFLTFMGKGEMSIL